MGIPVDELLHRMSSRNVSEYIAFFQVRREYEKEAELEAKAKANRERAQKRR